MKQISRYNYQKISLYYFKNLCTALFHYPSLKKYIYGMKVHMEQISKTNQSLGQVKLLVYSNFSLFYVGYYDSLPDLF